MERSNQFCFHKGHGENLTTQQIKNHEAYKALLKHPCRVIVNCAKYKDSIKIIVNNLSKDGLVADLVECGGPEFHGEKRLLQTASTSIGKAIEAVRCVMKKVNHCLYHGGVYAKDKGGRN